MRQFSKPRREFPCVVSFSGLDQRSWYPLHTWTQATMAPILQLVRPSSTICFGPPGLLEAWRCCFSTSPVNSELPLVIRFLNWSGCRLYSADLSFLTGSL